MKNLLFLSIIFLTISCGKHSSYNSNQDEVLAAQKAISMAQEAFFAVEQGNLKKLEEFLLKNVDINALNKYGKTLLIVAVEWKRYGIVKSLLSKGADTLITDEQGMDAIQYAGTDKLMVSLIKGEEISQEVLNKKLLEYVKRKDIENCRVYLDLGADINTQDSRKSTPLILSVYGKNVDMVKLLLSYPEIDVNKRGGRGTTALFWAKRMRNQEIIVLLKKAGAL